MKRRLTALLLAGSMVFAMAGCGNNEAKESVEVSAQQSTAKQETSAATESKVEEESSGITFPLEEPIEIDVVCDVGNDPLFLEDTVIMKHMEEMTNVKLNITNINHSEYNEKVNLMLNSGDYPDVFIKSMVSDDYGLEGILVDLTDLLQEYAPNYCAVMDAEDAWSATMASDGKIYTMAEIQANKVGSQSLWINQQWLDNLDLEMPDSAESFYEVLKAFKEQDADGDGDPNNEIPMIFGSADITPVECIWNYFGVDHQDWNGTFEMTADGELRYFPLTEKYKEITAYLKKLYEEELINQDCFTITCEQQRAMVQAGTPVGAFFDWNIDLTTGALVEGQNECGLEYTYVLPWEEECGKMYNGKGYKRGAVIITDKCEYPEIMVAWADYIYSYEGSMIATYGYEGEHYEVVDEDTVRYIGEWDATSMIPNLLQLSGGVFKPVNNLDLPVLYLDPEKEALSIPKAELLEELNEKDLFFDLWPALTFTEEENEIRSSVLADVGSYFKTYRAQVITGEIDLDDTWDDYIKTMEDMRIREVEKIYNDALARAKAIQ